MSPLHELGAVILAAGLSRRMGGPNKLLTPYGGEPLVAHSLKTVAALGLARVAVVTGRDAAEVAALAGGYGLRALYYERYADGLGGSLASGAADMHGKVPAFFVVLGDMPGIARSDYEALAAASIPGAIAVPVYESARGHPVLFCASYAAALAQLLGDEGARAIIAQNADAVIEVETANPGVLQDFDTPGDFADATFDTSNREVR